MRLLHTTTLQFRFFLGQPPDYVILSHRWEDEEVTLDDMTRGTGQYKKGYAKILGTCALAAKDEYEWVWIDSCCIDKSSSAELQEAINSMFKWYRDAHIYVLNSSEGMSREFHWSEWFKRGWTLQELVAPSIVEFYARDWAAIGSKLQRLDEIHEITGIPKDVLRCGQFEGCNAAERMSWAAHRHVARDEDSAYCLLGLFNINMPLLYGEGGSNAFRRLQAEIFKSSMDHTLFLFTRSEANAGGHLPLLAYSVAQFCQNQCCVFCRGEAVFPKDVSYRSMKVIPLHLYTKVLGLTGVHRELIFNADNVIAPLRMVTIDDKESSIQVKRLQDDNDTFGNGAAVFRVSDEAGRWICLGFDGPGTDSLQHVSRRTARMFFIEEDKFPRPIGDKLMLVFNKPVRPQPQLPTNQFQFNFVSRDFDLCHWQVRWFKFVESDLEYWELAFAKKPASDRTITIPMSVCDPMLRDEELMLYTECKSHDRLAIFILIRSLTYDSIPYIHAAYLHKISEIGRVRLHYGVETDRCNLRLPNGRLVSISLRRKPTVLHMATVSLATRYEITMEF